MNETKTELHILVDSIENPRILENLKKLLTEYVNYYLLAQKNEVG